MAGPAVCCPTCWSWSELGKRATCDRCGTPLIFADGQAVGQAPAPAPPQIGFVSGGSAVSAVLSQGGPPLAPPPAPPGWPPGAPATGAPLGPAWQAHAAGLRGLNWVAICRWAMGVYGALLVLLLIVIGLAVHNVTVPVQAADAPRRT